MICTKGVQQKVKMSDIRTERMIAYLNGLHLYVNGGPSHTRIGPNGIDRNR